MRGFREEMTRRMIKKHKEGNSGRVKGWDSRVVEEEEEEERERKKEQEQNYRKRKEVACPADGNSNNNNNTYGEFYGEREEERKREAEKGERYVSSEGKKREAEDGLGDREQKLFHGVHLPKARQVFARVFYAVYYN